MHSMPPRKLHSNTLSKLLVCSMISLHRGESLEVANGVPWPLRSLLVWLHARTAEVSVEMAVLQHFSAAIGDGTINN